MSANLVIWLRAFAQFGSEQKPACHQSYTKLLLNATLFFVRRNWHHAQLALTDKCRNSAGAQVLYAQSIDARRAAAVNPRRRGIQASHDVTSCLILVAP